MGNGLISCFVICSQLQEGGKKSQITGFNDPNIGDGKVVIDLVDSLKKGAVNYDLVKAGSTDQVGTLASVWKLIIMLYVVKACVWKQIIML